MAPVAARRLDRAVRLRWLAPFCQATVLGAAFILSIGALVLLFDGAQWREFGGASEQQGEAMCVRSQLQLSKNRTGWSNTFRLDGTERVSLDRDGCLPGRRYRLTYKIGRSGKLQILRGMML